MNRFLPPRTVLNESPLRDGAVTRAMVYVRTRELAGRAGRDAAQVLQADYEQAKREVTGESEPARQEARFEMGPGAAVLAGST